MTVQSESAAITFLPDQSCLQQGQVDAVTDRSTERPQVLELLNDALAMEILRVLRYRPRQMMIRGTSSRFAADEFLLQNMKDHGHVSRIARRITQLGGNPDLAPPGLDSDPSGDFFIGECPVEMLRHELVAVHIVVGRYRELLRALGDRDPPSGQLLREILAIEEQHADDLSALLVGVARNPKSFRPLR